MKNKIIFVGDKPSTKNLDSNVPFVGTQSYKKLLEWIWEMDIDIHDVKIINKEDVARESLKYSRGYKRKWIALGSNAEEVIKNLDIELITIMGPVHGNRKLELYSVKGKFDHFKLPHPSPKNRKLNDKKWIKQQLKECKEWLSGV